MKAACAGWGRGGGRGALDYGVWTYSLGIGLAGALSLTVYVLLIGFAIVLGVLLVRTLLWVIRALTVYVRERELRLDLLLADDDPDESEPADPSGPTGPGAGPDAGGPPAPHA